jgi:hypothetical protein
MANFAESRARIASRAHEQAAGMIGAWEIVWPRDADRVQGESRHENPNGSVRLLLAAVLLTRRSAAGPGRREEGRMADLRRRSRSHPHAPLDRSTPANFSNLEVAWRFKTDNLARNRK